MINFLFAEINNYFNETQYILYDYTLPIIHIYKIRINTIKLE